MTLECTPIPKEELELFKQLKDLKVIFDVGARTDTNYLEIWPESEHHLFEPNPDFAKELREKTKDKSNVFVNEYGLGDRKERRIYNDGLQSFLGSWAISENDVGNRVFPIKTLDQYITDKKVEQIDFLKIDTEGFELKVLLGATSHFNIISYMQYEHWGLTNHKVIKGLLEDDFWLEHVGYRNVFCMNKKLVPEEEYNRLKNYIVENKLSQLQ